MLIDEVFDLDIVNAVNAFNNDACSLQHGWTVNRLAIVSHPLDVPYRRFMFPYKRCADANGVCTIQGTSIYLPCEVDNLSTDNTTPRDGLCNGQLVGGRYFDGATGSADFEYANVVDEASGANPVAELAYGRVGADDISGATAFVNTDRCRILGGLGCATPPKGGHVLANALPFYTMGQSLWDDFYLRTTLQNCRPPSLPPPGSVPFCPNPLFPFDVMTYSPQAHFIEPMTTSHSGGAYEFATLHGHQDKSGEALTNAVTLPNHNPHIFVPCPPAPNCVPPFCVCDPDVYFTDRQRVQFGKGCYVPTLGAPCDFPSTRDYVAPVFSSEIVRKLAAQMTPPAFGGGLLYITASNAAAYNYIDHIGFERDPGLGPDSSFLTTFQPYGIAGYAIHMELTGTWLSHEPPGGSSLPRFLRELTLGKTLGEAIRDMGNYKASFLDDTPQPAVFHMGEMAWGDPDLKLNQQATPSQDDLVLLTSPGPGNDVNHPPLIKGFNKDGATIGVPNFVAYSTTDYGANVASGNIDSSPDPEIVTGAGYGSGFGPQVRAFQWFGTPISKVSFMAYGTLSYGANVTTMDVEGDTFAEIFTGPGPGATFGPQVRGWNYDGVSLTAISKINYFAFPASSPLHGVNVAGGNIGSSPFEELLVGKGPGPPWGADAEVWRFPGNNPTLTAMTGTVFSTGAYGVNVGVGDVDGAANGYDDALFGVGPGCGLPSSVKGFTGGNAAPFTTPFITISTFPSWAGQADIGTYGAKVAAANFDADAKDELVQVRGWESNRGADIANSRVVVYNVDCSPSCIATVLRDFQAYDSNDTGTCPEPAIPCGTQPPCRNPPPNGSNLTGGGLSVVGFLKTNVGIPPNPFAGGRRPVSVDGTGGQDATTKDEKAQGIFPATRMDTPSEILQPMTTMVAELPDEAFRDGSNSRYALLGACDSVALQLASKDYSGALPEIGKLRQTFTDEVAHDFTRGELLRDTDMLEERTNLAIVNIPPTARIETLAMLPCPGLATFTGSGSFDPDDRGYHRDDIQSYQWTVDGVVRKEQEPDIQLTLGPGIHTVTLTVMDTFEASSEASVALELEDGTSPTVDLTFTPEKLWPPDGSMVTVKANLQIQDACSLVKPFALVSISSNEPDKCGNGAADKPDEDVHGADIGKADTEFQLRAEDCSGGSAREYTVVYEVADSWGNVSDVEQKVRVEP